MKKDCSLIITNLNLFLQRFPVHITWIRVRTKSTWQPFIDSFTSIFAKILSRYRGSVGWFFPSTTAGVGCRYVGWWKEGEW